MIVSPSFVRKEEQDLFPHTVCVRSWSCSVPRPVWGRLCSVSDRRWPVSTRATLSTGVPALVSRRVLSPISPLDSSTVVASGTVPPSSLSEGRCPGVLVRVTISVGSTPVYVTGPEGPRVVLCPLLESDYERRVTDRKLVCLVLFVFRSWLLQIPSLLLWLRLCQKVFPLLCPCVRLSKILWGFR